MAPSLLVLDLRRTSSPFPHLPIDRSGTPTIHAFRILLFRILGGFRGARPGAPLVFLPAPAWHVQLAMQRGPDRKHWGASCTAGSPQA
jgi:hypothetical protein